MTHPGNGNLPERICHPEEVTSLRQVRSGMNSTGPSGPVRVPHVRASVRGPKKTGEAHPKLLTRIIREAPACVVLYDSFGENVLASVL
jgi:hypothetical protein